MAESKVKSNARDRILDAAEELVSTRGVSDLTLDAVAAGADLSKGGLLYHFASKEQLIIGLVQRITDELAADFERSLSDETDKPDSPGRLVRAMLRQSHMIESDSRAAKRYTRAFAILMATMVQGPELLGPIRGFYQEIIGRLQRDGLPPGRAEVIAAALDGLWLGSMFGLYELDSDQARGVYAELERLSTVHESEAVVS